MSISTPLTKLLGIPHPIVLAPMDLVADAKLTAAVSAAGGFGILGGGYGDGQWLARELDVLARSRPRFGVGFITWSMAKQPQLLDLALEHKPAESDRIEAFLSAPACACRACRCLDVPATGSGRYSSATDHRIERCLTRILILVGSRGGTPPAPGRTVGELCRSAQRRRLRCRSGDRGRVVRAGPRHPVGARRPGADGARGLGAPRAGVAPGFLTLSSLRAGKRVSDAGRVAAGTRIEFRRRPRGRARLAHRSAPRTRPDGR